MMKHAFDGVVSPWLIHKHFFESLLKQKNCKSVSSLVTGWDFHRIGPAVPPIPVKEGWLFIYYGEKLTSAGPLFRLGAAVLDRENPTRVLGRSDVPILSPREPYERVGDVGNLVFSCGAVLEDENQLRLYYGGSDSCICVGSSPVGKIVERCLRGREERE